MITLSLDLVFMKESINLFDPAFNFLNGYYPQGPIGMELPDFTDFPTAIVDSAKDVIAYLGQKIAQNDIDWGAIVAVSADLKNAATKFFATSAGQTNAALTRIFKPSRVYEYGCFNSYWTGTSPLRCTLLHRRPAFLAGCFLHVPRLTRAVCFQAVNVLPAPRRSRSSDARWAAFATRGRRTR